MDSIKTQHNKKALISAMRSNFGNVSESCEEVGLNRSTYYDYYNNDPEFKQAIDDIVEGDLDFAESQLKKAIKDRDLTAIIFYLKTKGKRRGYVERQELTGAEGDPLNVTVEWKRPDAI